MWDASAKSGLVTAITHAPSANNAERTIRGSSTAKLGANATANATTTPAIANQDSIRDEKNPISTAAQAVPTNPPQLKVSSPRLDDLWSQPAPESIVGIQLVIMYPRVMAQRKANHNASVFRKRSAVNMMPIGTRVFSMPTAVFIRAFGG
jgi:hypothetical protein